MWPFSKRPGQSPPGKSGQSRLGRRGESLARKHLKRQGLKILARNFRCPVGEVDIIALDTSSAKQDGTETIVFVEVKARSSDRYTDPAAAVDAAKRKRIKKVAAYYISHHDAAKYNVRFDIVSVVADGDELKIEHIVSAFQ